jgi:hypothetical protein
MFVARVAHSGISLVGQGSQRLIHEEQADNFIEEQH